MDEHQRDEQLEQAMSNLSTAKRNICAVLSAQDAGILPEGLHIDHDALVDVQIAMQDVYAKLIRIGVDTGIIPF